MTEKSINASDLFELSRSKAGCYIADAASPWEAVTGLTKFISQYARTLSPEDYYSPAEGVYISKRATVAPSALLCAPCVIEEGAEIRHCAYIRGGALIGRGTVLGNSCEMKNAVLFDEAKVPHFSYVGDSILGFMAHMGAGSIISNIKSDKKNVVLHINGEAVPTGMRKLGALIGDRAEIGCGSVLCPGSIIGRDCIIYPLSMVRGSLPAQSILKQNGTAVKREGFEG